MINTQYSNLLKTQKFHSYLVQTLQESNNLLINPLNYINSPQQINIQKFKQEQPTIKRIKINRLLIQTKFPQNTSKNIIKTSDNYQQQIKSKSLKVNQKKQNYFKIHKKNRINTEISDTSRNYRSLFRPKRKSYTFGIEQIDNTVLKANIKYKQKQQLTKIQKNIQQINLFDSSSGFRGSFYSSKNKLHNIIFKQQKHQSDQYHQKKSTEQCLQELDCPYFSPNVKSIQPMICNKQKIEKLRIKKRVNCVKKNKEEDTFEFRRSKTNQITKQDIQLCGWNTSYEDDSIIY